MSDAPHPAHGRPQRIVLEGRYARLEPIDVTHVPDLFRCASEERYRWLFSHKPESEAALRAQVERAMGDGDPLIFAVIDKATGRAEGNQSLMRITPEHGVIEIGGILWGDRMARTRVATEAQFVFARYVFDELGYRRYEWKCNNLNEPSKRAAERFGFTFEGVFRQHMIIKGQNRDTAWFSMLDSEWPRIKAEYERWLDPSNFDAAGRQKTRLQTQ
jgi:RimJ/RimL family protein N-acetyltransferase